LVISSPHITAVLLAAGRGTRFGGNKLEAMLGDAMLGLHAARTLAAMDFGALFAVHNPSHTKLAAALRAEGLTLIDNTDPDAGLSHSLALAANVALTTDADAMLICLADMPFITTDHLRTLIGVGGVQVIASAIGDARMPPALFPRAFWPMLVTLSGDTGARTILRGAITVPGAPDMLADIDTRADLNRSL
jgi:molybdenum cofactor cytidylyltransferase